MPSPGASSNHTAECGDALVADKMNRKPGGKRNPVLRDTMFNGVRTHLMEKRGGKVQCIGLDKLMIARGVFKPADLGKRHATLAAIKACIDLDDRFADFRNAMTALQDKVERAGHLAVFLPKFHAETNHIEHLWAFLKQGTRRYADGTMATLRVYIASYLQNVSVRDIRKHWGRCYQFIQLYGEGKTGPEAMVIVERATGEPGRIARAKAIEQLLGSGQAPAPRRSHTPHPTPASLAPAEGAAVDAFSTP